MKPHNGHRSISAWSVSLWLMNDETLYGACKFAVSQAIERRAKLKSEFLRKRKLAPLAATILLPLLPARTPDGHRYTHLNVSLALEGLIDEMTTTA